MPMHSWVDHTGELELSLEGSSREELFAEALKAFGELLAEHEPDEGTDAHRPPSGEEIEREIAVSAPDQATLLAEWLSELSFHAERAGLVPLRVGRLELADRSLDATVVARRGRPPHLVKAVTYHRLGMWADEKTWRARVVLDV
jgi:SHS2 domain-containing protein